MVLWDQNLSVPFWKGKQQAVGGHPQQPKGYLLGLGRVQVSWTAPLGPQGLGQDRCTSVPKLQGKLPASDY